MQPSTSPAGATAGQDVPQGTSNPWLQRVTRFAGAEKSAAPDGVARTKRAPNAPGLKNGGLAPKGAMEHPKEVLTVLPPAGREDQMRRWGLEPERLGDHLRGGDADLESQGFILEGGWHAVEPAKGSERGGGTTSHRGVLHPDEYVDEGLLRLMVERRLGFSYEQVRSVYRQGRLSANQRELRARIDARLLALSRAGGNMAELGRAFGFHVNAAGACEALNNALERARKAAT